MRKLSLLALFLGVVGMAACRDSNSGDDTTAPDSSTTGQDDKIQDIQNDAMVSGTHVNLKGVVVTAVNTYGGKTGDFWVQEPEGGEFSGIHVFGAPLDQVAALQVGDVVDIKDAEKDEFVYQGTNGTGGFDPGFGITELKPVSGGVMTVSRTGSSMVLQPQSVNALMIGGLTDYMARAAEWEKWEGVLIKVDNVRAQSADACVGSACNDMTLHKFDITGDIIVQSALAAMPTTKVAKGDCFSSVTGVVDYFFDYQLLPRTTAEIGTGGTGCATEDTQTLCGDGMDNDGNGFTDCMDNACVVNSSACRTVTAISAIQMGTTTGAVELQDVYVTGISFSKKDVWVSDNLAAAPYQGVQLHQNTAFDTTMVQVGRKIGVIGRVLEFNDPQMTGTGTLTEISPYSVTIANGAAQTPTPVTSSVTAATLTVDATAEPYEGVLVQLSDVRITASAQACTGGAVPPACNYGVVDAKQATTTFKLDDDLLTYAAGCYQTVTGIWSYNVYDNNWVFLPKAVGATGTSCPN